MSQTASRYQFGPFQLDAAEHRLLRNGVEVSLQLKAFETLCVLVENAGRLLKKEELPRRVWPDTVVEENNLNKNVSLLCKALGEHATGQSFIETVPRLGYRFVAQVTQLEPNQTPKIEKRRTEMSERQEVRFCRTHDGIRIAWAGVGSGYPLVKAANWLNHLDYEWESPIWRHWIAELTEHHRVIRYDERGNGLSDWDVNNISLEAWVEDLETVVDSADVDRFVLLGGISQGGRVAIVYTAQHPERVSHLVLFGTYSRGWKHRGKPEAVQARSALETLVRLDWGKNLPGFSEMFTKTFIADSNAREHQRWFDVLQRVSRLDPRLTRPALWRLVTKSTYETYSPQLLYRPSCFNVIATVWCRQRRAGS